MITADQIPDEAAWKLQDRLCTDVSVEQCRAALAAALNAWRSAWTGGNESLILILPLPKEGE
jgi:hypothetical protein